MVWRSSAHSTPLARASRISSSVADHMIWNWPVQLSMIVGCVDVADRDIVCMVHIVVLVHSMLSMLMSTSSARDFDWHFADIDCSSVSMGAWETFAPIDIVRRSVNIDFGHCICWSSNNRWCRSGDDVVARVGRPLWMVAARNGDSSRSMWIDSWPGHYCSVAAHSGRNWENLVVWNWAVPRWMVCERFAFVAHVSVQRLAPSSLTSSSCHCVGCSKMARNFAAGNSMHCYWTRIDRFALEERLWLERPCDCYQKTDFDCRSIGNLWTDLSSGNCWSDCCCRRSAHCHLHSTDCQLIGNCCVGFDCCCDCCWMASVPTQSTAVLVAASSTTRHWIYYCYSRLCIAVPFGNCSAGIVAAMDQSTIYRHLWRCSRLSAVRIDCLVFRCLPNARRTV